MNDLETQVVETWRIHQSTTMFLLGHIPQEAFPATLGTRGGRDVARQFAHMHNVRAARLVPFGKKLGIGLEEFEKGISPGKKKLIEEFQRTGEVMQTDYRLEIVDVR